MDTKLIILILVVFIIFFLFFISYYKPSSSVETNEFKLIHWNIMKILYEINEFNITDKTLQELLNNETFIGLINRTFTPDSNTSLLDSDTTFLIHPDSSLIGRKVTDLVDFVDIVDIVTYATENETQKRGFYLWITGDEKYIVISPLNSRTLDGVKLFYAYTVFTRSIPDYYIETLKNL